MPERGDHDWLADILDEAALARQLTQSMDYEAFAADPFAQRALLHMLQTIGEAAGKLSPETLSALPDLPWPDIRGMRNRIVHGYFGIDMEAVWRTASEDLPELETAIRSSGLAESP
ncbi:DUF86 domain-containing protein [Glycocaulis abyssi]|uniref:DUF86 domain-containing protein n=1 Tax=Glycocaulis abyssi TaxID=1433403 RepID=A0ABV9NCR2_9PROT